jgi:two-component system chemotaxis response regulator CheB
MAKMSGIAWFEKLMVTSPIPVVMISSLQIEKRSEVLRAFELGAIDYIQKPSLTEISTFGPNIREKVKIASFAKVIHNNQKNSHKTFSGEINLRTVLAIGASTGGTEALKNVMCSLPKLIPPTLIVQHIPSSFSKAFADRLNELCPFEVKEAEDGDELKVSRVLIAPGGKQMKIQRTSDGLCVRITDDAPINRHKPSVDYLFQSIALNMGSKAVGVLLTGMGADGAKGLLQMRLKGARTIAQDEESSVVYGMPRIAFEMGAVEKVAPLSEIPRQILKALEKKKAA